jgi:hypothetical protein
MRRQLIAKYTEKTSGKIIRKQHQTRDSFSHFFVTDVKLLFWTSIPSATLIA